METETKTEPQTTTPAPEPGKSAAPVAVEKTVTESVKTTGETRPDHKEIARKAFAEREEKREKKASERLAELEKEFEAYKQAKPEKPEPISFLDDPEGALKRTREEATRDALSQFEARQQDQVKAYEYRQASEGAADWLLTRSHSKQDKQFAEAVVDVVKNRLPHVAKVDPHVAMEMAYISVCKQKGVTPDIEGFVSKGLDATQGTSSVGIKPSATAEGKRTFTRGEAERYVFEAKPGSKEYRARLAEVEEAKREGRIK